jgi:hypothetical protein
MKTASETLPNETHVLHKMVLDYQSTVDQFNTDQGAQFTSLSFTKVLLDKEVKISMDGRGREATQQVGVNLILWMRLTGIRPRCNPAYAHDTHKPLNTLSIPSITTLTRQLCRYPTGTIKWATRIDLINQSHYL